MPRGKPIMGFPTIAACREAVKAEVDPYRNSNQEFEAPLTAALLAEHHYGCKRHNVKPLKFKWDYHPKLNYDDCFTAFFTEFGWRTISYKKALERFELTDATLDAEMKRHLRQVIKPFILSHKNMHPDCERCGKPAEDIDHVDPEFDDVASAAIALLTPADRIKIIEDFDWFKQQPMIVPYLVEEFITEEHKDAVLMAVCKSCHVQNMRERRGWT